MSLLQRVEGDLSQALRRRDEVVVRTLRMLKAALVSAAIAKRPAPLTEADERKVLRSEVKHREDAIGDYRRGGRDDLVAKEQAEVAVLKQFLPAAPDPLQLQAKVRDVMARLGATSRKDSGRVVGAVMKELGSGADGSAVSAMVREILEGK